MKRLIVGLVIAASALTPISVYADSPFFIADRDHRHGHDKAEHEWQKEQRKDDREDYREHHHDNRDWHRYRDYDWDRPEPGFQTYDPVRYYRDGSYYQPTRLTADQRIYRGSDGRYYCRRSDGTTGLIIGAATGALVGNQIAKGENKVLGTILGASAGALVGRAIDRNSMECR